MNSCDVCHKKAYGFAILGIMPWSRIEGRKPINVCMDCTDYCPCGDKGYWWSGLLTCKHGFTYDMDYVTIDGKSTLIFKFKSRKWWSYFKISKSKHDKTVNSKI